MAICRHCRTPNKATRGVCQNCGARLPAAARRSEGPIGGRVASRDARDDEGEGEPRQPAPPAESGLEAPSAGVSVTVGPGETPEVTVELRSQAVRVLHMKASPSTQRGLGPEKAFDGDPETHWEAQRNPMPWIEAAFPE